MMEATTTSADDEVPTNLEPSDFWIMFQCTAAMVLVYWAATWLFDLIAPDFSDTLEVKYNFMRRPLLTPEVHGSIA